MKMPKLAAGRGKIVGPFSQVATWSTVQTSDGLIHVLFLDLDFHYLYHGSVKSDDSNAEPLTRMGGEWFGGFSAAVVDGKLWVTYAGTDGQVYETHKVPGVNGAFSKAAPILKIPSKIKLVRKRRR